VLKIGHDRLSPLLKFTVPKYPLIPVDAIYLISSAHTASFNKLHTKNCVAEVLKDMLAI